MSEITISCEGLSASMRDVLDRTLKDTVRQNSPVRIALLSIGANPYCSAVKNYAKDIGIQADCFTCLAPVNVLDTMADAQSVLQDILARDYMAVGLFAEKGNSVADDMLLRHLAPKIPAEKDFCCVTAQNRGIVTMSYEAAYIVPPKAIAAMSLIQEAYAAEPVDKTKVTPLQGKQVLLLGDDTELQRFLPFMVLSDHASFCACPSHENHERLIHMVQCADIVVSALPDASVLSNSNNAFGLLSVQKDLIDMTGSSIPSVWYENARSSLSPDGALEDLIETMYINNLCRVITMRAERTL